MKMSDNQFVVLKMKIQHAVNGNEWVKIPYDIPNLHWFSIGHQIEGYDRSARQMVTIGFYRGDAEGGTKIALYSTPSEFEVTRTSLDPGVVRHRLADTDMMF